MTASPSPSQNSWLAKLAGKLEALGQQTWQVPYALGKATWFLARVLLSPPSWGTWPRSLSVFMRQVYFLGLLSMPIIALSGLFVGLVLGLQGVNILSQFGFEEASGQLASLALLRELAPAVAAVLYAGRAGSAITAEIGLMKTTEQLSALEMIGVDPLHRIVAPRFWASLVVLPVLSLVFAAVGIWGAKIMAVDIMQVDVGSYWGGIKDVAEFSDVTALLIKSAVFALLVTWIAVYQGYQTKPTAEGIGYATTQSVVWASVIIFSANFVLSAFLF